MDLIDKYLIIWLPAEWAEGGKKIKKGKLEWIILAED